MSRFHSFRALLLLPALALPGVCSGKEPPGQPNIVFLLSDDQRGDLMGAAGHPVLKTPEMDRLAREGVRFSRAFATTPICAASRASFFTGLWERTHRFTFSTPPLESRWVDLSYPRMLRSAGYRTGFVGKFGIQVAPGAEGQMFDFYRPLDRNPYMKKQADGSLKHLTEITADEAIRFIKSSDNQKPFCLSVSFNAPHAEDSDPRQYIWPPAMDHLYRDVKIVPPKTMTESFFRRQQPFLHNSESRVRFNWRFDTPEKYEQMVKGYFRMISGVDAAIGRIRTALAEQGIDRQTILVFSSDNGYFLGERGFADKWYGYEESLHIPFVVLDPRSPSRLRGRVVPQVALNTDLAPTLLQFAGIAPPREMQGAALQPLLQGENPAGWRTDFFFEHLFERNNIPKSEGVRDPRYTYIRWFEHDAEELYDRKTDPDQARNLVARASARPVLERLRRRTDELRDQYGGPFRPHPARP